MRNIFTEIGAIIAASILIGISSFYIICCIPYIVLSCIRDAYREDREHAKMHRSIEEFLNAQRKGYDDYEHEQSHTF